MATYQEFLKSKRNVVRRVGFDVDAGAINPMLFDWQRQVVAWALRRGRGCAVCVARQLAHDGLLARGGDADGVCDFRRVMHGH